MRLCTPRPLLAALRLLGVILIAHQGVANPAQDPTASLGADSGGHRPRTSTVHEQREHQHLRFLKFREAVLEAQPPAEGDGFGSGGVDEFILGSPRLCLGYRDGGFTSRVPPDGSNKPVEVEDSEANNQTTRAAILPRSYICETNHVNGKRLSPRYEGLLIRSAREEVDIFGSSTANSYSSTLLFDRMDSAQAIRRGHQVGFAYVTVITRPEFLRAAFALGTSLLISKTLFDRVALLSDEVAGNDRARELLHTAGFNVLLRVPKIEQPAGARVIGWWKEDSFTKLNVFKLEQYKKVIMMDADTVVAPGENLDHVFWLNATYAAVPELQSVHSGHHCSSLRHDGRTWLNNMWLSMSSCDMCENFGMHFYCVNFRTHYHSSMNFVEFNTGIVLLKPSEQGFKYLLDMRAKEATYNDTCIGAMGCNDQMLLNLFFSNPPEGETVQLLPRRYNQHLGWKEHMLSKTDPACQRRYLKGAIVFHWSGGHKPWVRGKDDQDASKPEAEENLARSRPEGLDGFSTLSAKELHHDVAKWSKEQPYCAFFETPFRAFLDLLRDSRHSRD
mmetsp:Transcript_10596/g.38961  ORF Transcript_10596/g.38961 Transcript_10596/m.38961 type:complete len:559 (-) Transcript_10596:15-1691(-)